MAAQALEAGSFVMSDLPDQYALNRTALEEMGIALSGLPGFDDIAKALEPLDGFIGERAEAGHQDRLVVSPSVQYLGLAGLTRRFQESHGDVAIQEPVWGTYGDMAAVHDNPSSGTDTENFQVALLLEDVTEPLGNDEVGGSELDEPGLVYRNMAVAEQRQALEAERQRARADGRTISSITVAQVMVATAVRRLAGEAPLDRHTFTKLIHYPDIGIDNGLSMAGRMAVGPQHLRHRLPRINLVPSTTMGPQGELMLDSIHAGLPHVNGGVRRVIELALPYAE